MFKYNKITRTKFLEKITVVQAISLWMISVWVLSILYGSYAIVAPITAIVYLAFMFVKVSKDNNNIRENVPKHKSLSALANQIEPRETISPNVYLVENASDEDSLILRTISSFKRDSPIITSPAILDTFEGPELQAAIAHEVSHVKNRHTTKLLVLSTLQITMYLNVVLAVSGTLIHVLGFDFVFGSHVNLFDAFAVTVGLIILTVLYAVMNTTTRIYQEHIADAEAAARIGDALTYIGVLEKFADNVPGYDKELLNHRKTYLYKIDSLIYK